MLNHKPIFVNSFARGGSNIIWEILQSHPDACAPIEETDKIIWKNAKKWKAATNIWLSFRGGYPLPHVERERGYWMFGYGLFHANNYKERRLNKFARTYLDELLYRWKLKNVDHPFNKYKTAEEIYSLEELKHTRVVAKHVNGLIFLTPEIIEMYPDSIHFGLVRNGLALCESRLRRMTFTDAGKFGIIYNKIVKKFIEYEERYPNFYLVKFEDLLSNPKEFVRKLYTKAGLKCSDKMSVRLKAKKYIHSEGTHETQLEEGNKYWVELDNICGFVDQDINDNQIKRMSLKDKQKFMKFGGKSMQQLGYI
jgi:hypothetical protein